MATISNWLEFSLSQHHPYGNDQETNCEALHHHHLRHRDLNEDTQVEDAMNLVDEHNQHHHTPTTAQPGSFTAQMLEIASMSPSAEQDDDVKPDHADSIGNIMDSNSAQDWAHPYSIKEENQLQHDSALQFQHHGYSFTIPSLESDRSGNTEFCTRMKLQKAGNNGPILEDFLGVSTFGEQYSDGRPDMYTYGHPIDNNQTKFLSSEMSLHRFPLEFPESLFSDSSMHLQHGQNQYHHIGSQSDGQNCQSDCSLQLCPATGMIQDNSDRDTNIPEHQLFHAIMQSGNNHTNVHNLIRDRSSPPVWINGVMCSSGNANVFPVMCGSSESVNAVKTEVSQTNSLLFDNYLSETKVKDETDLSSMRVRDESVQFGHVRHTEEVGTPINCSYQLFQSDSSSVQWECNNKTNHPLGSMNQNVPVQCSLRLSQGNDAHVYVSRPNMLPCATTTPTDNAIIDTFQPWHQAPNSPPPVKETKAGSYKNVHSLTLSVNPKVEPNCAKQVVSQDTVTDDPVPLSSSKKRVYKARVDNSVAAKASDTFGQRTSQYRGVTRHRWTGRYEAHLWDNSCRVEGQTRKGRQVYLGGYDKEEKAARAYDLAALKYWGPSSHINFPLSIYEKELEEMKHMTRQEFVASLRRNSTGFSRGASVYRGVTRHHQQGRWQARIGRVAGSKDLYLGTYSTQEEAAEAYDIAAIRFRGPNAVTNFDIGRYDVEAIHSWNTNLPISDLVKKKCLVICEGKVSDKKVLCLPSSERKEENQDQLEVTKPTQILTREKRSCSLSALVVDAHGTQNKSKNEVLSVHDSLQSMNNGLQLQGVANGHYLHPYPSYGSAEGSIETYKTSLHQSRISLSEKVEVPVNVNTIFYDAKEQCNYGTHCQTMAAGTAESGEQSRQSANNESSNNSGSPDNADCVSGYRNGLLEEEKSKSLQATTGISTGALSGLLPSSNWEVDNVHQHHANASSTDLSGISADENVSSEDPEVLSHEPKLQITVDGLSENVTPEFKDLLSQDSSNPCDTKATAINLEHDNQKMLLATQDGISGEGMGSDTGHDKATHVKSEDTANAVVAGGHLEVVLHNESPSGNGAEDVLRPYEEDDRCKTGYNGWVFATTSSNV